MKVETVKTSGEIKFTLDGELSIYSVKAVAEAIRAEFDSHESIVIDLSRVVEADSSGIQLLASLKKSADSAGKNFSLKAHSPAVLKVMDIYGLIGWFGDPVKVNQKLRDKLFLKYGLKRRR